MSHTVILSAREIHGVRDDTEYRRAHELAIAKKRRRGYRVQVQDSTTLEAYVNHGAWLIDCECGAGNAADREMKVAYCFGCGARHKVTFPRSATAIEVILLKRPRMENRNWRPGETLAALRRENADHGVA